MSDSDTKIQQIASSAWFMVIGRAAMVTMIPVLFWFGSNIHKLETKVEVLTVTVDAQRLGAEAAARDRYATADAIRDQKILQLQIDELKRRADIIERRTP